LRFDTTTISRSTLKENVGRVTDVSRVFRVAKRFNGDIRRWNVSSVVEMREMFDGASQFNQDIGKWDVSRVTIIVHFSLMETLASGM
jgi:surface protein